MKDPEECGFTLLELLISLTILSVMVVLIFGAFRIGVRAWEKGEAETEGRQRYRIVLDLVSSQITAVSSRKMKDKEGNMIPTLSGDEKHLRLFSEKALVPGNRFGIVEAVYRILPAGEGRFSSGNRPGESLLLHERSRMTNPEQIDPLKLLREDFHMLIPNAAHIGFEYLSYDAENDLYQWQGSWNPEMDQGLPLGVRIGFQENAETPPLSVIARIVQEPLEEASRN